MTHRLIKEPSLFYSAVVVCIPYATNLYNWSCHLHYYHADSWSLPLLLKFLVGPIDVFFGDFIVISCWLYLSRPPIGSICLGLSFGCTVKIFYGCIYQALVLVVSIRIDNRELVIEWI